jgi:hypothetical protein
MLAGSAVLVPASYTTREGKSRKQARMAKTKRHDEFRYSEFSIDACRFLGNSPDYAPMVTLQAVPDDQQLTRQMAQ